MLLCDWPSEEPMAKSSGLVGNTIRLAVTYNGQNPESTFNLEVFRWETNNTGGLVKQDVENWQNLSMDPNSARYVENFVNQSSKLVEISNLGVAAAATGYSQSGRPIPNRTNTIFRNQWVALMGTTCPIVTGLPWTGTSQIASLLTYTGLSVKTFTFRVVGAGILTVGANVIPIDWYDSTGKSGISTIPAGYTNE